MDAKRFDTVAKLFAHRRISRRRALTQGGAGLAAGALAAAGFSAATPAQDATPAASGAEPDADHGPTMLFLQSFQSGSITPKDGADGTFTLNLEHGLGQTIYFSDRPDRIVGTTPTDEFLQGIGFADDNPPNAALVIETAPGETDIAVVELFNPVFDPDSPGVTYDITVLANWRAELDLGFTEAPTDLAALAPSFGAAQLFIDDCPNSDIWCESSSSRDGVTVGTAYHNAGMCWNYSLCQPCEPYGHEFPSQCAAYDYWKKKCDARFGGSCDPAHGCEPRWNWLPPVTC